MQLRDVVSALFSASLLLSVAACGNDSPAKKAAPAAAHEEHKAPHGGEILELGEEEAHIEVIHDPKAGTLTLYIYGKNLETPAAVAAPTILLATPAGPKELTPTALDAKTGQTTATSWTLNDALLKSDPLDGRVRVTINGKQFQTPLEPSGHGK
jgi:hypothetical protein